MPIDNSLWGYAEPPKVVPVILYSFLRHVTLGIHPMIDYTQLERYYIPIYLNFSHGYIIVLILFKKKKKEIYLKLIFPHHRFQISQLYINYLYVQGKLNKSQLSLPTLPFRKFVPPPE